MKVKVTKSFASVVKETDLHPVFFKPGDIATHYAAEVALAEGWGEKIDEETDGANAALAAGVAASMTAPPPAANDPAPVIPVVDVSTDPFRARVKRAVDVPTGDGGETRYAKGAIVSGEIARKLVEEGFATPFDGEEKAKGAAPENK